MANGDISTGRMIRTARLRAGLKQKELAALLGCNQQRISQLERHHQCRSDTLERIGNVLGVRFAVGVASGERDR